jgi:hypothetical protein
LDSLKDLWPGQSHELLKALHILTRDGKLNQDSRRKLKQVQHLVQFLTPNLEGLKTVADLGAGKSYLGFMLYDLWMSSHPETSLFAVESRAELIQRSREIASRSGFDRIHFIQGYIDQIDNEMSSMQAGLPSEIDAITALHACDTATDDAIVFALQKNAKFIALVPCCQAEVARILDESNPSGLSTDTLWRHPIHRREFGSHLTNVIRGLVLEAHGYKVRVTELIGWEHSMKNELILAKKIQQQNGQAKNQLGKLLEEFPVGMRLLTRLSALGLSPI